MALGIANWWRLDKAASAAVDRLSAYGESIQEGGLLVLYFTVALWPVGAPAVSHWTTIQILNLIG